MTLIILCAAYTRYRSHFCTAENESRARGIIARIVTIWLQVIPRRFRPFIPQTYLSRVLAARPSRHVGHWSPWSVFHRTARYPRLSRNPISLLSNPRVSILISRTYHREILAIVKEHTCANCWRVFPLLLLGLESTRLRYIRPISRQRSTDEMVVGRDVRSLGFHASPANPENSAAGKPRVWSSVAVWRPVRSSPVLSRNAQERFSEVYRLVGGLHSEMFMAVSWQSGRTPRPVRESRTPSRRPPGRRPYVRQVHPGPLARIDEGALRCLGSICLGSRLLSFSFSPLSFH